MQTAKEKAANVAASAKSGMDKTKATAQEKVEKMSAHDPLQNQMATEKKQVRIREAELEKEQARHHNATAKAAGTTATGGTLRTGHHTATTGGTLGTGHHSDTGGTLGGSGY